MIYFSHFRLYKMKKNIIISIAIILLIVMFGMCACSRGYMEGFTENTDRTVAFTDLTVLTNIISSITSLSSLSSSNVLFNIATIDTVANAKANGTFAAFIDSTSNSLKIAKQTSGTWTVVWDSKKSNASWTGSTLTLAVVSGSTTLKLGSVIIANVTGTGDKVELTIDGDLVIKQTDATVIWSLFASELESAKTAAYAYMNRGSYIYQEMDVDRLRTKLNNFDTYVIATTSTTQVADQAIHKQIIDLRRQMDFEINEINGKGGSKLAISTTTLQSTIYLNIGITVLAISLIALLISR